MKLVCDCGNEMEFVKVDEKVEDKGQYSDTDYEKFETWAEHDEAGFTCRECKKSIWYFT